MGEASGVGVKCLLICFPGVFEGKTKHKCHGEVEQPLLDRHKITLAGGLFDAVSASNCFPFPSLLAAKTVLNIQSQFQRNWDAV